MQWFQLPKLTLDYTARCFLLTCREEKITADITTTDKTWLSLSDLPQGLLLLAAGELFLKLLPSWNKFIRKTRMKVVVSGQVHWKWWNKPRKRLLPYSPKSASIPEKNQRQQDHERQKIVWSRGQRENHCCLSPLPTEARLIRCLCSLPIAFESTG